MKLPATTLLILVFTLVQSGAEWRRVLPGWTPDFPRDHYTHPDFKTEWWYFTGHLKDSAGHNFGFQITFFRQGIRPPGSREKVDSRFVVDHFHFGHFAISDLGAGHYHFHQVSRRGSFGEAGNGTPGSGKLCWLGDWSLTLQPGGNFKARATMPENTLELTFHPKKPPVINGEDGASQKAAGEGNASHYYSFTRLATSGTLTLSGKNYSVTGESWLDREWGTGQLGKKQVGWDWFSLQFDDASELMLYQLREDGGAVSPYSSGTYVGSDGTVTHLTANEFTLIPVKTWTSTTTKASYPLWWTIDCPGLDLRLDCSPQLENQEFAAAPVTYWEGAIRAGGTRGKKAVKAQGYLELTGYAGRLTALGATPTP